MSFTWMLLSTLLMARTLEAYKALIMIPVPSKSHSILGNKLADLIAEAGNEVIYLTPYPRAKPPPRVKQIDLSTNLQTMPEETTNLKAIMNNEVSVTNIISFITVLNEISNATLLHEEMQKLMNDPNEKIDVIIAEWLYNEIYSGLAPVFNCPFIWLATVEPHWKILKLVDEAPNPSYTADIMTNDFPPFTFLQRLKQLGLQIAGVIIQYFFTTKRELTQYDTIIAPIIRKKGYPVPDYEDLVYNASLVLGNSHVLLGKATKLPHIYKSIAGYHIPKDVQPLPGDLQRLLDNAKHGVIYFSLGSNLKSKYLPDELKRDFLRIFGGLQQTVLWKFEEDLPGTPPNVHIIQWAPQQSILAHKNCILFISHGGFLSTIEAVHFGKPIIGIPVFGDQFSNVENAVRKGYAKKVELSYNMAETIRLAIKDIVGDPRYTAKAKQASQIYHDRLVSPAAEAVHWVQHVVRTRGALHLRSPALLVPWYQKMYLDLLVVVIGFIYGLKMLFKKICSMLCRKKTQSKKKKN